MNDPFATPERRQLRELTRLFVEREVLPHLDDWERAGEVPRSLHKTAAATGLLGRTGPRYRASQGREVARDGYVTVSVEDEGRTIEIGGSAVTVVDGTLRL